MGLSDSKLNLVTAVCQEIQGKQSHKDQNLEIFAYHFFKRAPIEFLQKMQLPELVSIVQEAWELLQMRPAMKSLVKIKEYTLSHHIMPRLGIFMVNLDQPFLIDSITAFLEQKGFKTELVVHPVLGIQRTKDGKLVSLAELKQIHPQIAHQPESIAFIQIKSTLKKKQISNLLKEINLLITQVRNVVSDWPDIKKRLTALRDHLSTFPLTKRFPSPEERQDLKGFLSWLEHENFVFLGGRHFSLSIKERDKKRSMVNTPILCLGNKVSSSCLPPLGLFRDEAFASRDDLAPIFCRSGSIKDKGERFSSPLPVLLITKTSARSTVHRPSRIDSIEIIELNDKGEPQGLYQFIGIFTKTAFMGSAFDTPLVSRKAHRVFDQFGLSPQWHDGKALINIIDSIPRDELFYLDEEQIHSISQNVLNMNDQHSLTLSIRPDLHGQYIAIMIFLPREKYSVALKERISRILEHHLKGKITSDNVLLGELSYARLVFAISCDGPCPISFNQPDIEKALLEASLSWQDHLERLIGNHYDEENTATLLACYQNAFPASYIDTFKPEQALTDISYLEKITDHTPIDLYLYQGKQHIPLSDDSTGILGSRRSGIFDPVLTPRVGSVEGKTGDEKTASDRQPKTSGTIGKGYKSLKVKIFHARHSLSLSTLLPILQNLGLQVIGETSYALEKEGVPVWIHDFDIDLHGIENWKANQNNLISAFHHIWNGTVENDVLHQLIPKAGLHVRQVMLVRAYLKFLRQLQLPYSLEYLGETLSHYPEITRHFVEFFELRFGLKKSKTHEVEKANLLKNISYLLESVDRLDHDRILRRVFNAIEATVRTNYFQNPESNSSGNTIKPYLSLKFDCAKLDELPQPRPLYEIFIYSPRFEAIHLRGAKVARGGIRWSDRPEDFRTEILGLMKAQTLKNAVIVPLGSKGGFVVKNQTKFETPANLKEEVVSCYQMMMRGILDLTDNLVKGKVVHPPQVIRLDGDDPYLVVAADKGTAEFSDIANRISNEYGFWLDDAFASGGSTGYDHKKMAITSRGVWESVKRHFRELKHDCQTTPFTVIGVGDMSGDVFGNGMLLSPKIRLLGAFNHKHIFLDPDPDPEISFKERKRLFDMPRSTWADYNWKALSKGGGVFDRSVKSISLSPQICNVLGVPQSEIRPDDLIRHLLCLPVDFLYFGGIGTFVKASTETHTDVGDRSNNDIRVDAKFVQAKIIGEGANLAMTQRARVEFALKGGYLNTDAIDNSAGVDCSDHEVNLKILFATLGNVVSFSERNDLLRKMENDVAQLVLADNYRQNQILSVLEKTKPSDIHIYQTLMRTLEVDVSLDRFLEALPDDETLEQRRDRNQGMTRPELSVLLGYSKIALYEKILNSPLPDKPAYLPRFHRYFPEIIQKQFSKVVNNHPLRREITATLLANEVINRVGPTFTYDISRTCGVATTDVVEAFLMACDVLELENLWKQIDNLDPLMVPDVQIHALLEINQALEQAVLWFLRHPEIKPSDFSGLASLLLALPQRLHGDQLHIFQAKYQGLAHLKIPEDIARNLSLISFLPALLDVMLLSKAAHNPPAIVQTYFTLRSKMGLDWLAIQASQIHADSEWQRSARTILMDDLAKIQVKLTNKVMMETQENDVDAWTQRNKNALHHIHPILSNMKNLGHSDLGMLGYAVRQLERLI